MLFCLSLLYLSVLVGGWYCGRLFVCLGCGLGLFAFVVGFWVWFCLFGCGCVLFGFVLIIVLLHLFVVDVFDVWFVFVRGWVVWLLSGFTVFFGIWLLLMVLVVFWVLLI